MRPPSAPSWTWMNVAYHMDGLRCEYDPRKAPIIREIRITLVLAAHGR